MTESEMQFFRDKGLHLPKRCKECRRINRQERDKTGITVAIPQKSKAPVIIGAVIGIVSLLIIIVILHQNTAPDNSKQLLTNEPVFTETTISETTVLETTATETTVPETTATKTTVPETTVPETTVTTVTETVPPTEKPEVTYVLNTYRMKFHKPTCPSVSEMNYRNRVYFYGTREDAVAQGYSPCGNCKP